MRSIREVIVDLEDLSEGELRVWIDSGWIRPARTETDYAFSEMDIARVSLIADLRQRMGINDEAMPVVLRRDLMPDQLYGLISWIASDCAQPVRQTGIVTTCRCRPIRCPTIPAFR